MKRKHTNLSLDERLLAKAKEYAASQNKSLSRLIEDYLIEATKSAPPQTNHNQHQHQSSPKQVRQHRGHQQKQPVQ